MYFVRWYNLDNKTLVYNTLEDAEVAAKSSGFECVIELNDYVTVGHYSPIKGYTAYYEREF